MMTNKYYTYIHYKADTLEPFYIGKGKKNRHKVKSDRNNYWNNVVAKHGFVSEILSVFNDEKNALEHEKFLIATFRSLGYKLVNLTDGGEGTSGFPLPEHVKESQRKRFKEDKEFAEKCTAHFKKFYENPEMNCNYKGKIIATDVNTNKELIFNGQKELIAFGFQSSKVYACLSGRRKTHKGYSFKRVNNEYNVTQSTNANN
jgi:hypothetical protein